MSDWQEQAKKMYAAWSDTQKSLLDGLSESVRSFAGVPDADWWEKTLEVWEKSIENAFSSQAEMTDSWVGNLTAIEGLPEQAVESIKRFHEMASQWQGTQQDLWSRWLEMVKGFSPARPVEEWSEAFRTQVETWQQATQKVMEAQEEWMSLWTGKGKEPSKEGK